MTLVSLTAAFGWMSVINIAFLTLSAILMLTLKGWAIPMHARMFGLEEPAVRLVWYRWLGNYKILVLIFSIVPYFALRLAA